MRKTDLGLKNGSRRRGEWMAKVEGEQTAKARRVYGAQPPARRDPPASGVAARHEAASLLRAGSFHALAQHPFSVVNGRGGE